MGDWETLDKARLPSASSMARASQQSPKACFKLKASRQRRQRVSLRVWFQLSPKAVTATFRTLLDRGLQGPVGPDSVLSQISNRFSELLHKCINQSLHKGISTGSALLLNPDMGPAWPLCPSMPLPPAPVPCTASGGCCRRPVAHHG